MISDRNLAAIHAVAVDLFVPADASDGKVQNGVMRISEDGLNKLLDHVRQEGRDELIDVGAAYIANTLKVFRQAMAAGSKPAAERDIEDGARPQGHRFKL